MVVDPGRQKRALGTRDALEMGAGGLSHDPHTPSFLPACIRLHRISILTYILIFLPGFEASFLFSLSHHTIFRQSLNLQFLNTFPQQDHNQDSLYQRYCFT